MKWLVDLLLFVLRALAYREAARSIRRKGVVAYLKTLQLVRKALMGSIAFYFFLQLFFVGFVGCLVVGVFLLPEELNTKLWILLGIFGFFFLVPLAFLLFAFSEKVWYQMSGAEKMLADADKEPSIF